VRSEIRAAVAPPSAGDLRLMARALEMAELAASRGEVPVGAVLAKDDDIFAEGHNLTVTSSDPTAHAEVVVIREAARKLGDWRLTDFTLYVTLEPCTMCAGALVLSRIRRLVFGALDPKAGMVGSLGNLIQDDRLNHWVEMTPGVLADASRTLLQDFFRARRGN
jgi:tRNA(adenine34) deaminase